MAEAGWFVALILYWLGVPSMATGLRLAGMPQRAAFRLAIWWPFSMIWLALKAYLARKKI